MRLRVTFAVERLRLLAALGVDPASQLALPFAVCFALGTYAGLPFSSLNGFVQQSSTPERMLRFIRSFFAVIGEEVGH
jgi:hypothetical protein